MLVKNTFQPKARHFFKIRFASIKANVFLPVLQIFGWLPEPYNSTKLPAEMPESLKTWIQQSSLSQKEKDGMIWFSCVGENPADSENIGQIDYYPYPGVPTYFYPYKNQEGYHSPAVFAHFSNPKRKYLQASNWKFRS